MKILWIGSDGMDIRLLDYFRHPFWEEIRFKSTIARIPCPESIEAGWIAKSSSPRLWARYYTGVPPKKNGVLGFWEKLTPEGEILRAKVSLDWLRKNRCEKLVCREDLLVEPIWTIMMKAGLKVGGCNLWFSFPLQDYEKELIDKTGSFFLTDWMFPREHPRMEPDLYRWPPEVEPKEDYEDETGAGARIAQMRQEDPEGTKKRLIKQDNDRLEWMDQQIKRFGMPDIAMVLTRGVDAFQHGFKTEEDLRVIYTNLMDGVEKIWKKSSFDILILCSDHGTGLHLEGEELPLYGGEKKIPKYDKLVLHGKGEDHAWPAYIVIHPRKEGDFPVFDGVEARYEDLPATVLELLGVEVPKWYEGKSLWAQAALNQRLREDGYF